MARSDCSHYVAGIIDIVAQMKNNGEQSSKRHTSLSGSDFILKARQWISHRVIKPYSRTSDYASLIEPTTRVT